MTYADALNYAISCGLTRDQALHLVRGVFGRKAITRIERDEEARSEGARSRRLTEEHRRRALKLWREMRQEVRKKRDNALQAAATRPTEADYHTSFAALCDRVHTILSKAEAEEQKRPADEGPMRTPLQVGAARGLPNSGLHWPDWVPPHIKKAFEAEAERIGAMRPNKARPPRPFYVSARDAAQARLRSLEVALEAQQDAAEARFDALLDKHPEPDPGVKRQMVMVAAEMVACRRALGSIRSWPRTRPVPVNPLDAAGVRMTTLQARVDALPTALLDVATPQEINRLAVEVFDAAQADVLGRKKYLPPADRKQAAADAEHFDAL